MLLETPGEVVTGQRFERNCGRNGTFVDFNSNISSAVRKLRDSLCDSAASPRYVETVGRIGYRFVGQAECGSDEIFEGKLSVAKIASTA